jgi:hypothetical protein
MARASGTGRPRPHAASARTLHPLPDALPDVVKPGFHGVRTHWIRGFMTFQLARRAWIVMLIVPV